MQLKFPHAINSSGDKITLLEIPTFVCKIVSPIVLFFGNLIGKNKKFSAAPLPAVA